MTVDHEVQHRQYWAHLRDIHRPKCGSCHKFATHELYNGQNALMGRYCRIHAKKALARYKSTGQLY
jgi:hypothetical protein